MKAVKVLTDPKAFELMADDTRRRMINLLKAKEMTVSQIAESLNKTPQNIYHHIRKLADGGLVEVAREERVENFVERYYRSTAEIFEVTHGKGEGELSEGEVREFLKLMSNARLVGRVDDSIVSKAVKLLERIRTVSFGDDLMKKAESLEDAGLAVKLHSTDYASLLLMSNAQFEEYQKLQKQFRQLLKPDSG